MPRVRASLPSSSTAAAAPLAHADIAEIVEAFRRGARHALEAGFDGLEVHLGHGHLLNQFLSPASNIRTDAYGGSEEHRLRFSFEVLRAVRDEVGPDFTLGIRISADEFLPDGLGLEDMAPFLHLPRRIKAVLPEELPVFAIGRIDTLEIAEQVLAEGIADMVGMTRAHIADPDIHPHATPCLAEWRRPNAVTAPPFCRATVTWLPIAGSDQFGRPRASRDA
jgi:dimethylglycine catabolism A